MINWNLPIELANDSSIDIAVDRINGDIIWIKGSSFIFAVHKTTGLPSSDIFNWDAFPVQNKT